LSNFRIYSYMEATSQSSTSQFRFKKRVLTHVMFNTRNKIQKQIDGVYSLNEKNEKYQRVIVKEKREA